MLLELDTEVWDYVTEGLDLYHKRLIEDKEPTDKLKDFMQALATRYNGKSYEVRDSLNQAYSQAMTKLAKKYPEGITEESATENNAKVTRRIVVRGLEGHLYVRKETSFGPIYFFKDNVAITETEYLRDTEVQQE